MQGRSRLNFSEWNTDRQLGAGEIVEKIQEGEMPPAISLPLHPTARLTAAEEGAIDNRLTISFARNTIPWELPGWK